MAAPRRKVSVFSLNGFPDARLLESQLKEEEQQKYLQRQLIQNATAAGISPDGDTNPDASNKSGSLSSEPGGSSNSSVCDIADQSITNQPSLEEQQILPQQVGQTDSLSGGLEESRYALGSTSNPSGDGQESASPRPASADSSPQPIDQTIATPTNTDQTQSTNFQSIGVQQVNTPDHNAMDDGLEVRPQTPTTTFKNDAALVEPQISSPSSQVIDTSPKDTKTELSATNTSSRPAPIINLPETQLIKDSKPDRHLIQQHIDNLISQNKAIIDNWNLVSIRSYNSSRDSATGSCSLSSTITSNTGLSPVTKGPNRLISSRLSEATTSPTTTYLATSTTTTQSCSSTPTPTTSRPIQDTSDSNHKQRLTTANITLTSNSPTKSNYRPNQVKRWSTTALGSPRLAPIVSVGSSGRSSLNSSLMDMGSTGLASPTDSNNTIGTHVSASPTAGLSSGLATLSQLDRSSSDIICHQQSTDINQMPATTTTWQMLNSMNNHLGHENVTGRPAPERKRSYNLTSTLSSLNGSLMPDRLPPMWPPLLAPIPYIDLLTQQSLYNQAAQNSHLAHQVQQPSQAECGLVPDALGEQQGQITPQQRRAHSTCSSPQLSPMFGSWKLAQQYYNSYLQQTDPMQLESAIQNLSLKRKDSEAQLEQYMHQQQQQLLLSQLNTSKTTPDNNSNTTEQAQVIKRQSLGQGFQQNDLENLTLKQRPEDPNPLLQLHHNQQQKNHQNQLQSITDLSILKQQLLCFVGTDDLGTTVPNEQTKSAGSLPFKKRKISDPNIRW